MAKGIKKQRYCSLKWTVIILFTVLWMIGMGLGWVYLLPHSEAEAEGELEREAREIVKEIKEEVKSVVDKGIYSMNNLRAHNDPLIKRDIPSSPLFIEKQITHPPVTLTAQSTPVPQVKIPQEIYQTPPPPPKAAPAPLVKPAPKAVPKARPKTGDMWKMKVSDQRDFLQNLHEEDLEPGTAAAQEFIEYAQQSLHREIPKSDPVNKIWPFPSDTYSSQKGYGKPGDQRIPYHIAGKDVSLPYGYPEESIFILTASYRDPEAASTIARAFARAAHPDRIFVGIHAQNTGGDEEPERDPIGGLKYTGLTCPSHPVCSRVDHIRVSRAHFDKSEGPTVARALAERHYRNETYVLGIDSHCHFLRGWDNVGIDMFKRLKNDMALITAYPASYSESLQGGYGGEEYDVNPVPAIQQTICRTKRVNVHTTVSFKHDMNTMKRPSDTHPIRVAFFAAGFSFSRGHRILRVPYDYYTPYIFDGEETSMGVRAWTWGYDLYQPDRDIISHFYIQSHSKFRPVFWDSPFWSIQWPTQFGSLIRIQKQLHIYDALLGSNEGNNPYANEEKLMLDEIGIGERYGVGPHRDVEEYWRWAHVDLKNNWGVNCDNPDNPEQKDRTFCLSKNLCDMYFQHGGMPYIPWHDQIADRD